MGFIHRTRPIIFLSGTKFTFLSLNYSFTYLLIPNTFITMHQLKQHTIICPFHMTIILKYLLVLIYLLLHTTHLPKDHFSFYHFITYLTLPFKLSIWTHHSLNLFHFVALLQYVNIANNMPSCESFAKMYWRFSTFAFNRDVSTPATFLPLINFLVHFASSIEGVQLSVFLFALCPQWIFWRWRCDDVSGIYLSACTVLHI